MQTDIRYSPDDLKRIMIVRKTVFYGTFVLITFALVNVFLRFWELCYINLAFAFSTLFIYFLILKGKYRIAFFCFFSVVPLHLLSFPFFVGAVGAEYYLVLMLIMVFYVFDSKLKLILISLYLVLCFVLAKGLLVLRSHPPEYKVVETIYYYSNISAFLLLIIMVSYVYKTQTTKSRKIIEKQAASLTVKVDELHESKKVLEKLLAELNHRVKNNLQLVSGLFTMQMYNYTSPEVKQALKKAQQRIDSIAILHQHLYKQQDQLAPNIKDYTNQLVNYLIPASGFDSSSISCRVTDTTLPITNAMHIGLIVNELLTNAIKYASNKDVGDTSISVNVDVNHDTITITVTDNGNGFPKLFSIKENSGFGFELVETIAQKYDGNVEIKNNKGGAVTVKLYRQKVT